MRAISVTSSRFAKLCVRAKSFPPAEANTGLLSTKPLYSLVHSLSHVERPSSSETTNSGGRTRGDLRLSCSSNTGPANGRLLVCLEFGCRTAAGRDRRATKTAAASLWSGSLRAREPDLGWLCDKLREVFFVYIFLSKGVSDEGPQVVRGPLFTTVSVHL